MAGHGDAAAGACHHRHTGGGSKKTSAEAGRVPGLLLSSRSVPVHLLAIRLRPSILQRLRSPVDGQLGVLSGAPLFKQKRYPPPVG